VPDSWKDKNLMLSLVGHSLDHTMKLLETSIFEGQFLKTMRFPNKTEVIWVLPMWFVLEVL